MAGWVPLLGELRCFLLHRLASWLRGIVRHSANSAMSLAQIQHVSNRGSMWCCIPTQVSFGPISWLIVGEVFPLAVRGQAAALATVTNFGSNFLVNSQASMVHHGSDVCIRAILVARCVQVASHLETLLLMEIMTESCTWSEFSSSFYGVWCR